MRTSVGVLAALSVSFGVMASSIAWGAEGEPVGYVKNVDGEAFVTSAGSEQKAVAGSPVHVGSVLRTGRASSMGVTFKDNTVMSFGPDTELTIDEYLYAPGQDELKFGASLLRGAARNRATRHVRDRCGRSRATRTRAQGGARRSRQGGARGR